MAYPVTRTYGDAPVTVRGVAIDSGGNQTVATQVAAPDNTIVPGSEWEAAMLKSRTEADIGDNTAKGYQADTYYKIYRSLQELMFSLANAGVIDQDTASGTGSIYGKITGSMEDAMNAQANVWEGGASDNLATPAITVDLVVA